MNVGQDSSQRAASVPGRDCCGLSHARVAQERVICRRFRVNDEMLCHTLGGAVIFVYLQHFIAPALDFMS